ncbi:uncharacterized protein SPSK_10183 [Sporothrix schenckii 1099-18]|uniref:Uncharacterized protein n=1 Tax=Sporothrix schenckii 1099-18 TaxID=1397361 RepID=A0A0F2M8D0_SPOSC|nr:uncharacterized protein SPSK_10183 [Sporothrix schenckii 1099-18]KJR85065.1 hypothetical protein SPSK_10183 [Sporothrix schenckii 1099-18]
MAASSASAVSGSNEALGGAGDKASVAPEAVHATTPTPRSGCPGTCTSSHCRVGCLCRIVVRCLFPCRQPHAVADVGKAV